MTKLNPIKLCNGAMINVEETEPDTWINYLFDNEDDPGVCFTLYGTEREVRLDLLKIINRLR